MEARQRVEQERQLLEAARQEAEEERRRIEDEHRRLEEARQHAAERQRAMEEETRRQAEEEEARLMELEALRQQAEEEGRRRVEQEQRIRAEIEALRRAEEEQHRRIEIETKRRAEIEARIREEEARGEAQQAARIQAEEEARRLAEEARIRAENEAQRRAEAEARLKEVIERQQAEHQARVEAEQEAQRLAEEARLREEQYSQQQAEIEARQRAEDEGRLRAEAEARHREEEARLAEEARQQAEEEERLRLEHEAAMRAEEEARLQSDQAASLRREATQKLEEERRFEEEQSVQFVEEEPTLELPEDELSALGDQPHEFAFAEPIELHTKQSEELPSLETPWDANLSPQESVELITDDEETVVSTPEPQDSLALEPEEPVKELDVVQAEKGITQAEDESAIPADLLRRLNSHESTERAAALADISRIGGDDAFVCISKAFDDQSADVRNAAARSLYDLQSDRAASFTRALREGSPDRRRKIGAALAASGLAANAIANLTGESREKTYDAFSLLFLMAKAGEVQPLMRAIEDYPNIEVRLAVVKLLALSGQPEIVPAFRRLAVRGSLPSEVRSAVMEAIYQISSQSRETAPSAA
jgi:hypothetical protein